MKKLKKVKKSKCKNKEIKKQKTDRYFDRHNVGSWRYFD